MPAEQFTIEQLAKNKSLVVKLLESSIDTIKDLENDINTMTCIIQYQGNNKYSCVTQNNTPSANHMTTEQIRTNKQSVINAIKYCIEKIKETDSTIHTVACIIQLREGNKYIADLHFAKQITIYK